MLNGKKRVIEIDKEEAGEFIALSSFEELKGIRKALSELPIEISKDKSLSQSIEKLIAKLDGINLPEVHVAAPPVKVEVNQKEVVISVENLAKDLLVELRKLNSRPVAESFTLRKSGYNGQENTVTINYKK